MPSNRPKANANPGSCQTVTIITAKIKHFGVLTRSSFSEELPLNLEITNHDIVLGDESAQATRAITDIEGTAIGLIGTRIRCFILAVQVTCYRSTLRRRDPN
jgi:hypothetical protein